MILLFREPIEEERCNNNDLIEPTGFSIKSILNDESYGPSIDKKKGKLISLITLIMYCINFILIYILLSLDVEMNEELHDEVYYKLLPAMFKISELIQRSRDYWEKSYILRDENEKKRYKIMANDELTKAINGLKRQKLTKILFFNL